MKYLNIMDKAWLLSERREVPMHVAGVALYTMPEGVDSVEYLQSLVENLRNATQLVPPYGDRLKTGPLGVAGAAQWEPDPDLDLDYHIRHSALPEPGRYRELFTLVSRLHGTLLDRRRPLWEMHLIEGLKNRQFAVYTKTHHAAVDGARSIHISRSMLSADPDKRVVESPLSMSNWRRYRDNLKAQHEPPVGDGELANVVEALKATFDSGANIYTAARRITRAWIGSDDLLVPFRRVPRSSFNTSVSGARRFVAQSWPFARIRAVAKAYDATFNDTILAMCGGALRTYLLNYGELPDQSLKAMVPISVRREGDVDSSNAVATINADLGTDIADPARRIAAIHASTSAGKQLFMNLSPQEATLFTMLLQTPGLLLMPLGLTSRIPPFNTVISNVPGIQQPMYWNGSRLDGLYPLSIVTDGVAMNITLVTNAGNVDFGIIACRRSMPHVQRIIDYMEDSLVELEEAAGIATGSSGASRKTAKTKAAPKARAKAAPKAKAKAAPKAKAKAAPKARAKAAPKARAKA